MSSSFEARRLAARRSNGTRAGENLTQSDQVTSLGFKMLRKKR
jgi:hypothetical protein